MTDTDEPSQLRRVCALRDGRPVPIGGPTRRRGVVRLEADVLAENQAMLSVFRRCGLPMTTSRSDGVVHLVPDLSAQGPATSVEPKA